MIPSLRLKTHLASAKAEASHPAEEIEIALSLCAHGRLRTIQSPLTRPCYVEMTHSESDSQAEHKLPWLVGVETVRTEA